jgi:DNA-binding CsgD family transcriptional regulator
MKGLARFEWILNSLARAKSLPDVEDRLRDIRDSYGLTNVVYHAIHIPRCERENAILLLTYEQAWVSRYIERDYFRIDPVVRAGRGGFLPIDWRDVDRGSPEARRFFAEADSYGVGRNGVSLPIRGANGERAIFTLTSNTSDREWRAQRLVCIRDFQTIAHYVHDRAVQAAGILPAGPKRQPSTREVQCLQAFARGRPPKRIAADLGISESAVRLYLHSIRSKLVCATIPQAVGVALTFNLIRL